MKSLTILALTVTLGISLGVISLRSEAATPIGRATQGESANQMHDEAIQVMAHQMRVDLAVAPIKSESDLANFLYSGGESALDNLTGPEKQRFLSGLIFTKYGLASFPTTDLTAHLTATQIYQVLSLFGMQSMTSTLPGVRVETDLDQAIMSANGLATPYLQPNNMICDPVGKVCVANKGTDCNNLSCRP